MFKYCPDCNNTGIDIHDNPCHCRVNVESFYDSVSCMDIPEQYRGVQFNTALVPTDMPASYAEYLKSIYLDIVGGKWKQRNVVIASPVGHSKTIMAYSAIEAQFRVGLPVFPIFDLLEIKRILFDMDMNRKQIYDVEDPENVLLVPILFVKIPVVSSKEVYEAFAMLLDRRVRRGNSTIFLYNGTWKQFTFADNFNVVKSLAGDGSYNTVEVKTFLPKIANEHNVEPQGDIG